MASLTLQETQEQKVQGARAAEFLGHQTDLLSKVLSLLPLRQILQLRLVCKAWNLLLRSPRFLQAWTSSSSRGCWLVMSSSPAYQRLQLIAYNSASSDWIPLKPFIQSLPSPALTALGGLSLNHVASCNSFSRHPLAAASTSGLVCFALHPRPIAYFMDSSMASRPGGSISFRAYIYSVIVLNLVTGAYHLLPSPKEMKYSEILVVSMQALPPNAHYRIYVRFQYFPWKLDVYDSTTRLWTRCDFTSEETNFATTADLRNADFIWYRKCESLVLLYSADSKKLTKLHLPHVDGIRFPSPKVLQFEDAHVILRHRDRVLLAAVQSTGMCLQGFSVSELHVGNRINMPTAMLAKVATTPPHLWWELEDGESILQLLACGSLIWMSSTRYTLVYDIARDYWYHLPAFEGGKDCIGAFSLQPSFASPIGGSCVET